jgi:peroxiredoxin
VVAVAMVKTSFAASKGYKITVKLESCKDSCLFLAHYYGNKQYLDDTAFVNNKGFFEFAGEEKLPEGMYIIAGQNKSKYFDFFLTGNQQIETVCDPNDIAKTMLVKGSDENKRFYEYINYISGKQKEIEPLNKWLQEHKTVSDSSKLIQSRIETIDKTVKEYIKNYWISYPDLLSARFIKANNDPDIRQYIIDSLGKVDSSRIYTVYKQHYFDNLDFSDSRLIYTPVFTGKIDFYMDKMVVPSRDSLEKDIDRLMSLSSANEETQKYLAWYLSLKYESSEIMGHDALFVYIVRQYLETGKAGWMYPSVKDNILKRVNAIEPIQIGKVAPNLILLDTLNTPHSLITVKAKYTLLFFWESTCGHCQKEMPNVIKFYDEFRSKYGLEIFGVSGDTNLVKWKEYIRKNDLKWINTNGYLSLNGNYHDLYDIRSTPVMYLLDEDKKIISKFLLTDQIADLIKRREEGLRKSHPDNNK